MYLGKLSYNRICSAFMHVHQICDVGMEDNFSKQLTTYITSIKGIVASEKKETGRSLSEEKRACCLLSIRKYARSWKVVAWIVHISLDVNIHYDITEGINKSIGSSTLHHKRQGKINESN